MKEEHTNETVTQTIFESMDTIRDLKSIEKIVKKISSPIIDSNPSNLGLITLLRINEDQLSVEAPLYAENPYVETFFIAKNMILSPFLLDHDLRKIFPGKLENNPVYQELKKYIRQYTSTPDFERKVRSNRKSERKRELSAENYIEAFRHKYARLVVIRLDLYLTYNIDRVNYTKDLLRNL